MVTFNFFNPFPSSITSKDLDDDDDDEWRPFSSSFPFTKNAKAHMEINCSALSAPNGIFA
jgi:hypothetical protein